MTKPEENKGNESGLDYQQLAEHMLSAWQDQWRQFAGNKQSPFAESPFGNYSDWMQSWTQAVSAWTQPAAGPTAETANKGDAAHAKPSTTGATSTPSHNTAAAAPVSSPAGAPSNARDVLLTELARRVEFLHDRVVALEAELTRLKSNRS